MLARLKQTFLTLDGLRTLRSKYVFFMVLFCFMYLNKRLVNNQI